MIAADRAVQRPPTAKLLAVDSDGRFTHIARDHFADLLRPGDLVVANDAATLPASLHGIHLPTGASIEVRLAGWTGVMARDVSHFAAVVFGTGDYHTRTEQRLPPPTLAPGDRLRLGPLSATIKSCLGHPRLVSLEFDGSPDAIWAGIAHHGRPIQYAHIAEPLALWDVWTVVAGPPVAFEPPSAGFALSWKAIEGLHRRGVGFATMTHAAGLSSTGDTELDKRLPLAEPYSIPDATAMAIASAHARGGRIVAIGTTVVRALEHAARLDGVVRPGSGIATQRIDSTTRLTLVDAVFTGTHEPGTSHHDLLSAFAMPATIGRIDRELEAQQYRTHEFGDSVFIERAPQEVAHSR
jgi:S-adenosylmethionine:tRNA ribosyltransferase-isomerase